MSLALRKEFAANAQQLRVMNEQYKHLNAVFREGSAQDFGDLLKTFGTNAARTPAEAYREFDLTSKIDMVPAGEYATLTRLMQKSRSINIGKEVFEYRQTSNMDQGQSSMSGQIGVDLDKVAEKVSGTVVPIHDKGFGRRWRAIESMRADGYDALVDDAREARRGLMGTLNRYLWDGNEKLALKDSKWLGIKNDPTVATATIGIDLTTAAASAVRTEVSRIRDILYITNIPFTNRLVECFCLEKHCIHISDITYVPIVYVLIKIYCSAKHVTHIRNTTYVPITNRLIKVISPIKHYIH